MWRIINVVTLVLIGMLSAILGGEYKNPLHLLALGALIAYAIIIDLLIKDKDMAKNDLKQKDESIEKLNAKFTDVNTRMSQLLLRSNLGVENKMYMAVIPSTGGQIIKSISTTLQVVLNAPYEVQPPPDLRLLTNQDWGKFKVDGRIIFSNNYGSQYEYTFKTSHFVSVQNTSNKLFLYSIEVEFSQSGMYEYTLEAKSVDFFSQISNTFEVA
ncbi:hypothetical protein GMA19_03050 [Paenibacillus polymyxa E681]|uniref:hypothetical protein n=1 Tax=Paenibacillus polymyxa TaxID=1406 RepID=UPI0001E31CB6|nr:hypothetical protein [Paenibacillus polymyxa]ADM70856.1 hypothetical protein PPE_03033 [Paenibacillus polymyxa E681]QNV57879.1 hypothetical protein GE561_03050 [Paenibacillus polymyxa E681]QNV62716.1 hypothetical protein GMA19_03050 [Paenibacillus polymyxa E681]